MSKDTINFHRTQMKKEMVLAKLRKQGCRITQQRRMLLDVILEEECASCKEIYYKASFHDPAIGTATVYRMINLLEDIGAISRKNMYRISYGTKLENEINYHEIIECITCALDAKDPYTAGHSQRVSDMALKVCELIGLKEEDKEKIHIAAHLHDIGKIGVPDAVLNKEGKLTEEEFESIKRHPAIGAEIPIGARIIAICDSIDAITSNRCYRKAHDFAYCYEEIEKNLGKMYDPIVGRYVLDNWDEVISVVKQETGKKAFLA